MIEILFFAFLFGNNPAHPVLPNEFHIEKAAGEITIDGDISDPAWQQVSPIHGWVETNPGDNVIPKVRNIGYITYDDRYFYAAFYFEDPQPGLIRAPIGDRDHLPGYTDYGGVLIDTDNTGISAQEFFANVNGVQYDAISNDSSGEDSSPDFFWEAKGKVVDGGWTLELKIPFSSLRYPNRDIQTWGLMLYRNYPREYRYQMFTSILSRDKSCFICNVKPLMGLENLPEASSMVIAPFVSANQTASREGDLGSSLNSDDPNYEPGLDFKWRPTPALALDATINPDFSQVESDVAQISANERFALFFPEKRPFFLEGLDLFSTPIRAVHTRSFTSPRWGARATGRVGDTSYTTLVGEDRGGGSVIIPGSNSSRIASQDYESLVAITRVRRDFGNSYASMVATHRQVDDGGFNSVVGPDFRWRPSDSDQISGQLLYSMSETPERMDLDESYDGRELEGHAADLWWSHSTSTIDWFLGYEDYADGFRADNGFVPQVGFQRSFAEIGYTFRPKDRFIHRLRLFSFGNYSNDRNGQLLTQMFSSGFGMSGRYNSFQRYRYEREEVLANLETFVRDRFFFTMELSPGLRFSKLYLNGILGDEVDFTHDRLGSGTNLELGATVRPTNRLVLDLSATRRTLDVDGDTGEKGRLFTATVGRLSTTYYFSSKMYLRLIGQQVETTRNPALWAASVDEKSGFRNGSLLFAYKLNWQSVLFLGYGDDREFSAATDYEPTGRQAFFKVSYAFQR